MEGDQFGRPENRCRLQAGQRELGVGFLKQEIRGGQGRMENRSDEGKD
jgi:hypothetical protein